MFPLALFDVLTAAECPGDGGVGFADFFAGITAGRFCGVGGSRGAVAVTTVVGGEMGGCFAGVAVAKGSATAIVEVKGWFGNCSQIQRGRANRHTPVFQRLQLHFGDTVLHTCLLLAGDIHDVQRQEFAWDAWEGDIEMDFHLFACSIGPVNRSFSCHL